MSGPEDDVRASADALHCDVCDDAIEDDDRAFLLCSLETLPDAPTIHLVKQCCLPQFDQQFDPVWTLFSLASPHAQRLLPYLARISTDPASP